MKHLTEGNKMFLSVMVIFAIYAVIFILFEDFERYFLPPAREINEWHMVLFSFVVMVCLSIVLLRYARRMDERISREQADKQNRMRRELTQNISHELKTPVASILGYTETILAHPDMDQEMQRQFIVRTQSQAQRLTSLLQDISTLNRMDYAADMIKHERVDVSHIVSDIIQETGLDVAKKQMNVRNHLPQDIIINGNPSLIYSIFRNLMDNAIKYAGEGTTVEINAHRSEGKWHFTFADDGAGLNADHLPRIFERFYRIDKGRSRALGGTGLGLAIVKNAVQLHGGVIEAHSSPGQGLQFNFSLSE